MPGDIIRKFLKLFCIVESGEVRIEPSWESWCVLIVFLLASILLAVSGVYFHLSHINLSSIFCFVISAVGFGLTLVAFLAILLGYNRRRRSRRRVSNRNNVGGINDSRNTRPAISEESVWVDIEKDVLTSSHNSESNRRWMNPVYGECDNSFYEAELKEFEFYEEVDSRKSYEEVDSDDSRKSSRVIFRTFSYDSSSEDDDYYQITTEESDLNEVDEHCFGNYEDCGGIVEQKSSGQVETLKVVSNPAVSAKNLEDSMSHQESKLDRFQVYMHNEMTSLLMPEIRNRRQSNWRNLEEEILLQRNSSPVDTESGFYENAVCLESSFHSNYEEPNGIYLNTEECDGMQQYPTACQNAHVNMDFGTFKHPTVVSFKHESHTNTGNPNELERSISFYSPKSYEECQNDNKNSKLIQGDQFTVTNKDIDFQTTEENNNSCSLSKPVSSLNANTTLLAHGRHIVDIKSSKSLEQRNGIFLQKPSEEYCNAYEISKSHRKSYSRSAIEHCDRAASSRPMCGFESNSPTARRHRQIQYPSREDFEDRHFWDEVVKSISSVHVDRKRWNKNMIRDRRRTLLDANGVPISQREFGKELAKLLQKGLQSSKHPIYARPYNYA